MMKRPTLLIAMVSLVIGMAVAQNGDPEDPFDEEALFDTPLIVPADEPTPEGSQELPALPDDPARKDPTTRVGGRYSFSVAQLFTWTNVDGAEDLFEWPDLEWNTSLRSTVYLDARPADRFRVYAEAEIDYPFDVSDERDFGEILRFTELFSDFRLGDHGFLRGGKHTVTWGVGYFFSPADIINLERIDPEEPERDREGPVSVKMEYASSDAGFYLFALPPVGDRTAMAWAPRIDTRIRAFEFSLGGYGEADQRFAAMLTATGSIRRLSVFGEVVVHDGSDRRFVRETTVSAEHPLGLEAVSVDDTIVNTTAGLRYSPRSSTNRYRIIAIAQYFFNDEGYEDSDLLIDRRDDIAVLIGTGDLRPSDLIQPGRHYAAATVNWTGMLGSDISTGVSWYGNLSDRSGRASLSARYALSEPITLDGTAELRYGTAGSEFAPDSTEVVVDLSLGWGSGRF